MSEALNPWFPFIPGTNPVSTYTLVWLLSYACTALGYSFLHFYHNQSWLFFPLKLAYIH